jgi:hypothetical protein
MEEQKRRVWINRRWLFKWPVWVWLIIATVFTLGFISYISNPSEYDNSKNENEETTIVKNAIDKEIRNNNIETENMENIKEKTDENVVTKEINKSKTFEKEGDSKEIETKEDKEETNIYTGNDTITYSGGLGRVEYDGKYGFINEKKEWIIEPIYESVGYENFENGLCRVALNNKWGVIDKNGAVVIDFQYKSLYKFDENGQALIEKESGEKYYINKQGKKVAEYKETIEFSEGLGSVKYKNNYGFVNDKLELVIEPIYYDIGSEGFRNGYCRVKQMVNNKERWGFINKKGEVVIPLEYDWAMPFSSYGVANVEEYDNYPDEIIFINLANEIIVIKDELKLIDYQNRYYGDISFITQQNKYDKIMKLTVTEYNKIFENNKIENSSKVDTESTSNNKTYSNNNSTTSSDNKKTNTYNTTNDNSTKKEDNTYLHLYYAKELEESYLKQGLNIEVLAYEGNLMIKTNKLANAKVVAYAMYDEISKDKETIKICKDLGFNKITFIYDNSFLMEYYTLELK